MNTHKTAMRRNLALLGFLMFVTSFGVIAQETESNQNQTQFLEPDIQQQEYNYNDRREVNEPLMPRLDISLDSTKLRYGSTKKRLQQDAFTNRKYYFPAKPKDQWEVGFNLGIAGLSADVKGTVLSNYKKKIPGYGLGLTVRKGFSYLFSVRGRVARFVMTGQDWQPSTITGVPSLNGTYDPNLSYSPRTNPDTNSNVAGFAFNNYRNTTYDLSIEGVFSLGNKNYHRERSKVVYDVFFGLGFATYNTKMDQLDENGQVYDYITPNDILKDTEKLGKEKKKDVLTYLYRDDGGYDGEYESQAEFHQDEEFIRLGDDPYVIEPYISAGLGMNFHLSKRITLNATYRGALMADDLLDGSRRQENNDILTRNFDAFHYVSAGINFNIGKKGLTPIWWQNPLHYSYQKLAELDPRPLIEGLLVDDDDDGVPNRLDHEPETPKGCPVSPKGIALDSDKDGCIDCLDKEPFSPPGYPIDENCVAIVPDPECCGNAGPVGDCRSIELPSVFFSPNKYFISPEYFAHLHSVAEKMQMCPDINIVSVGYADKRRDPKYNEKLSWNRVNKVIDYLVKKYGISRDRFIVQYRGDTESLQAQSEFDMQYERRVDFRFAEEGETGDSNPPDPHPGLKAGTDR